VQNLKEKRRRVLFEITDATRRALERVCRQYHVHKLSIFRSTLHGNARPDSNLDVLVEFEPGRTPGFAFAGLQRELSAVLGRSVDLRTAYDLSRHFRDEFVKRAQVEYVATEDDALRLGHVLEYARKAIVFSKGKTLTLRRQNNGAAGGGPLLTPDS
jgi:predicted nucleotidyltransferase